MLSKQFILLPIFVMLYYGAFAQQTQTDPDPLRFQKSIDAFTQWDQKNSFPKKAVLFVGSSSINLWETARAFPDYPVINRGFGGSHISDAQFYYEQVIGKYNPALVVFYAGDNDIAAGKPVEQVFNDYKELVNRLLDDQPDLRFLYITIKPSSSRWKYWNDMSRVNELIKNYNNKHKQLFYIDLASPLLNLKGQPDDSLFRDDQLHLNRQGYKVWNRVLKPKLEKIVQDADVNFLLK